MLPGHPPAAAGVCPHAQRPTPGWCARRGAATPRAPGRHSPAAPERSGSAAWQVASRRRPAAWRERDDLLLCTPRCGKEVTASTGEVLILGAKPGGGEGQGDDIHIGAIGCLEAIPGCAPVIRIERKIFPRDDDPVPHG